jgi:hypothetical protein
MSAEPKCKICHNISVAWLNGNPFCQGHFTQAVEYISDRSEAERREAAIRAAESEVVAAALELYDDMEAGAERFNAAVRALRAAREQGA